MSNEKTLLHCTFGWGKTCRLGLDSIEIAGKSYNLDSLTSIHSTYRTVFGVPSARLELRFGPERLVLRGIPDSNTARLMVTHLQPYCADKSLPTRAQADSIRSRDLAKAQAKAWERTNKLPVVPVLPRRERSSQSLADTARHASLSQALSFGEEGTSERVCSELLSLEMAGRTNDEPSPAEVSPPADEQVETDLSLTTERSLPDDPWLRMGTRLLHTPRFQPPLHSVHLIPPGQKSQDTSSMPVPVIKSSVLPIIHVPVRLQAGECAHYSIGASLCSDRISGSERAPYPPLDHGLLILTNRRIFYLGKRSQLILAYAHLWYVSLLHNAIALHIEQQFRRIIIELEHPQEWASRIEQLAFIARRTRPQPERPTLLMASLPGLPFSMLNAITLKRPALKKSASGQHFAASITSLVPEYVEPHTTEAQILSFENGKGQPTHTEANTLAFQSLITPGEDEQHQTVLSPDPGDITMQTPIQKALQDLSQPSVQTEIITQELHVEDPYVIDEFKSEEDQQEETIHTDALCGTGNENTCDEIDTRPLCGQTDELQEEDVETIPLRNKRMPGTGKQREGEPASDRLPDLEITVPRLPCIRPSRVPVSTKNERE